MERQRRVKFSVEARRVRARFRVGVQARSIGKGLRLVGGRHPRGMVEVAFPTEAVSFSVPEWTDQVAA